MKPAVSVVLGFVLLLLGLVSGALWKGMDEEENRRKGLEASAQWMSKVQSLEESLKATSKERDEAREDLERLKKQGEAEVIGLQAKLAEAEKKALLPKEGAAGVAAKGTGEKPMKMLAQMMNAPGMKEVIKQQQLAQLDMIYGGLFQKFHLNDAEKQDLKNLIAERVKAESDLSVQLMGGSLAAAEIKSAVSALKNLKDANDQRIRTFLNNEGDYQMFQSWEGSKGDRMMLTLGQSAFASAGEPLSGAQEDQLVAAMAGARTRRQDIPDLSKIENMSPSNMAPAILERVLASLDVQAQEVYAAAASFLTPKQLEALKSMQAQQKTMQETGIKMGAAMFGGGK